MSSGAERHRDFFSGTNYAITAADIVNLTTAERIANSAANTDTKLLGNFVSKGFENYGGNYGDSALINAQTAKYGLAHRGQWTKSFNRDCGAFLRRGQNAASIGCVNLLASFAAAAPCPCKTTKHRVQSA